VTPKGVFVAFELLPASLDQLRAVSRLAQGGSNTVGSCGSITRLSQNSYVQIFAVVGLLSKEARHGTTTRYTS